MSKGRFQLGVVILALLAILDAVLKSFAITHAPAANGSALPFFLAFALHKNPGIAFDIPLPIAVILPITLVIGLVFGASYGATAVKTGKYTEGLACVAICIGAFGNFADRLLNNFTTDYLILFRTSAINISDILILIGMLAFLWYHKSNPRPKTT